MNIPQRDRWTEDHYYKNKLNEVETNLNEM